MNKIIRTTRACTMETLNEDLQSIIRAHGALYGLSDMETDILICRVPGFERVEPL